MEDEEKQRKMRPELRIHLLLAEMERVASQNILYLIIITIQKTFIKEIAYFLSHSLLQISHFARHKYLVYNIFHVSKHLRTIKMLISIQIYCLFSYLASIALY